MDHERTGACLRHETAPGRRCDPGRSEYHPGGRPGLDCACGEEGAEATEPSTPDAPTDRARLHGANFAERESGERSIRRADHGRRKPARAAKSRGVIEEACERFGRATRGHEIKSQKTKTGFALGSEKARARQCHEPAR